MANHTQGKSPCKEKWQQKEYNFEFLKEYFYFSANDMLGGKHSCEYSYIFRLAVKFMFFFVLLYTIQETVHEIVISVGHLAGFKVLKGHTILARYNRATYKKTLNFFNQFFRKLEWGPNFHF